MLASLFYEDNTVNICFRRKMYLQKNLFWARMRMCPANKDSCCLLLLISNQTFLDSPTLPPFARQANPWKLCYGASIFLTSQETICCRRVWWSVLLMNFVITEAVWCNLTIWSRVCPAKLIGEVVKGGLLLVFAECSCLFRAHSPTVCN